MLGVEASLLRHRKPNACHACYDSRVRCVYPDEPRVDGQYQCVRCAKGNRVCQQRIFIRGSKGAAGTGNATDVVRKIAADSEEIGVEQSEKKRRKRKREGLDKTYQEAEIDALSYAKSCLKSLDLHDPLTNLSTAQSFLKFFEACTGRNHLPETVRTFANSLFFNAVKEKSAERLHMASALALTAGITLDASDSCALSQEAIIKLDATLLGRIHPAYKPMTRTAEKPAPYSASMSARDVPLSSVPMECFFIIRHESGVRNYYISPMYQHLFQVEAFDDNSSPWISSWKKYFLDRELAEKCAASIFGSFLLDQREMTNTNGGTVMVKQIPDVVTIKDHLGNLYSAKVYAESENHAHGFLTYNIFSFVEIQPLDFGGLTSLKLFHDRRAVTSLLSQQVCFEAFSSGNSEAGISNGGFRGSDVATDSKSILALGARERAPEEQFSIDVSLLNLLQNRLALLSEQVLKR